MTRSFPSRVLGAALLAPSAYEDVEADPHAIGQAVAVVLLSALAAGVGSFGIAARQPAVIAVIAALALIVWIVWAFLVYQIGARLMPTSRTQADIGQLLRTLGFATAPGLLRVFGVIPGTTTAVFAITEVWMLMAMVVAVRQALDYTSTVRAIVACGLGWVVAIALGAILGMLFVPALQ